MIAGRHEVMKRRTTAVITSTYTTVNLLGGEWEYSTYHYLTDGEFVTVSYIYRSGKTTITIPSTQNGHMLTIATTLITTVTDPTSTEPTTSTEPSKTSAATTITSASLQPTTLPSPKKPALKIIIPIAIVGVLLLAGLLWLFFYCRRRRSRRGSNSPQYLVHSVAELEVNPCTRNSGVEAAPKDNHHYQIPFIAHPVPIELQAAPSTAGSSLPPTPNPTELPAVSASTMPEAIAANSTIETDAEVQWLAEEEQRLRERRHTLQELSRLEVEERRLRARLGDIGPARVGGDTRGGPVSP